MGECFLEEEKQRGGEEGNKQKGGGGGGLTYQNSNAYEYIGKK